MIPPFVITFLQNNYPKWSPTMYKATLAGAVVTAFVLPLLLLSVPMIEFFNGMAAQQKGKTQMTYGRLFGPEMIVARDPVPGTVHREFEVYPFDHLGNTIDDSKKAGETLVNPVPLNEETMERGKVIYDRFCIVCHGPKGQGDGSVTGVNPVTGQVRFPAPPSLHTEQARGYTDGAMYHIVTKGQGQMPAYRIEIEPEDRWKAIHYVRALQRAMNPKPEDLQ